MTSLTYKPKDNHPWRRYKGKELEGDEAPVNRMPLRVFLTELVNSWEEYTVDQDEDDLTCVAKNIKYMSDKQIALWLTSFMKKHWIGGNSLNSMYYEQPL